MGSAEPRSDDLLAGFGANERAIIERVPTRFLRRVLASVLRAKMRLQFTGWLQYVIPLVPLTGLLVLGGLAQLLGLGTVAKAFAVCAGVLLAVVLFDVVTVKFRVRLPERRPASNDQLDLFDLMRARRSCRSFQTRLMDDGDREVVLASVRRHVEAPRLGPKPVRLEYIRGDLTVWPTVNGSEFLVAIAERPYNRLSVIDVGRTLQKVVMEATRRGLGTCWIGPGADHVSLKRRLGDRFDPERDQIICTCALGYRSSYAPLFVRVFNGAINHRRPLSGLFFSDAALSEPIDTEEAPYAQFGRTFEACQWGPSSYNGQTTRAVVRTGAAAGVDGVDLYSVTSSKFYAPVALGIWCANWELGCEAVGLDGRFETQPAPDGEMKVPRHDVTWVPTSSGQDAR